LVKTNGHALRKCRSWIESFVEYTDNIEAPEVFRRWAAITIIASVLEQKVWITTSSPLYPNLYCFIIGHPGVGKTRTVRAAAEFVRDIPDFHCGDTSMTSASLTDRMAESRRVIPEYKLEYNTMLLPVDEFSAFIGKYDDNLVGLLTTFYDVDINYSQSRRGKDLRVRINRPQLSMLCGSTPSHLLKAVPEFAWDQGFTSRVILIFSDERPMLEDVFSTPRRAMPEDMKHDLRVINALVGQCRPTSGYAKAINDWRHAGQPPCPGHPRLTHYCTRRLAHVFKLSIVASVDRGDSLELTEGDFEIARGWLLSAEERMGEVFKAGAVGADAKAIEEIMHFITVADVKGEGVYESKIIRFVSERIPIHSVMRVLEIMEKSRMIKAVRLDPKTGMKVYSAVALGSLAADR
jgi:hypothetical protein